MWGSGKGIATHEMPVQSDSEHFHLPRKNKQEKTQKPKFLSLFF